MRLHRFTRRLAAIVAIGTALGGCSSSSTEPKAQAPAIVVAPELATVEPSGTVEFDATVTGTANTAVTWTVNPAGCGSVTTAGLYSAPSSPATCEVVVRSQGDTSLSAAATVQVVAPSGATVRIAPATAYATPGQTVAFGATVSGAPGATVTWSVAEASGCGSITQAGSFTAPQASATCHVVADIGIARDTATVAVLPRPTGTASLGVNIENVSDWAAQHFFADVMKQARAWSQPGNMSVPVPVDVNGWPTGDAAILVGTAPGMLVRAAPYALSFTGNATVTVSGGTVSSKTYQPSTNTTTAAVTITTNDNVVLTFRGQAGGVKNVKLMRPGHLPNETFDHDLLARISHFGTLRFMQALGEPGQGINGNPSVSWSDRTLPGAVSQQSAGGIAWEYVVALANLTGKDPWINLPLDASDAYITQLARLLRYGSDGVNPYTSPQANPVWPPLDPARKVYVEVVNELWNTSYQSTIDQYNTTVAELGSGDPHHLQYKTCNTWECSWRRVGWLAVRASLLFRSVFGDSEMMSRVRPVLAMQLVRYDTFNQPLDYVLNVYGPSNSYGNPAHPVNYYLYAISGAPYVNIPDAVRGVDTLTVDDVFTYMAQHATQTVYPAIDNLRSTAATYGVAMLGYEGGQHLLGTQGSATAKLAAQTDPRMKTVLVDVMHYWYTAGGGAFMYYTLCSTWGSYGYFGLSPDISSEATPKWDAVKAIASGQ